MRSLKIKTIFISILFIITACSSEQKKNTFENPVLKYKSLKLNNSDNYFGLEAAKSEAAMYLYSQAKTDLKSGNSQMALEKLSEARLYNPWHDDIKDLYVVSSKIFIETTKNMGSNCSVVNDRLSFIYTHSPDFFGQVSNLAKKCNFKVSSDIYKLDKLPFEWKEAEVKVFHNFENELDSIIKINSYIPRRELLIEQLKYISNLSFSLSNVRPSRLNLGGSKVEFLIDLSVIKNDKANSKNYCLEVKRLLYNKDYEEEEMNAPGNYFTSKGYLQCQYFNRWLGRKKINFFTLPNWKNKIHNIWPLPQKIYFDLIFNYKSGNTKVFKTLVTTKFSPESVEAGFNFGFESEINGLSVHIQHRKWIIDGQNVLILSGNRELFNNLSSVKLNVNYKETLKYYLK